MNILFRGRFCISISLKFELKRDVFSKRVLGNRLQMQEESVVDELMQSAKDIKEGKK